MAVKSGVRISRRKMCLKPISPDTAQSRWRFDLHSRGSSSFALLATAREAGRRESLDSNYTVRFMDSIAIAGLIALVAFWVLLVYGWAFDELHVPGISVFIALWCLARFGLPYFHADGFFITCVAVLDIALVFIIFKGDVPIT
jgi:hypothetical protein